MSAIMHDILVEIIKLKKCINSSNANRFLMSERGKAAVRVWGKALGMGVGRPQL